MKCTNQYFNQIKLKMSDFRDVADFSNKISSSLPSFVQNMLSRSFIFLTIFCCCLEMFAYFSPRDASDFDFMSVFEYHIKLFNVCGFLFGLLIPWVSIVRSVLWTTTPIDTGLLILEQNGGHFQIPYNISFILVYKS